MGISRPSLGFLATGSMHRFFWSNDGASKRSSVRIRQAPAPSSNEFTMISRPVLRQLPTHRCQGGTLHPSRGPFSADNALTGISRDRTNIHRRNLSAAADAQSSRHGVFVPLCLTNPEKQAAAHPQSRGCLLGQSTLALSIRSGNYRNNPQTRPR